MVFPRCRPLIGRGLAVVLILASISLPRSVAHSNSDLKESTGELAPADVLKSKNLRRSGAAYVLGTEMEVQRKLAGARKQLAQFRQAAAQQNFFEMGVRNRKAFEEQLIRQRAFLNSQLAEVDQQTPSLNVARFNEAVNAARNELVDQHNRLAAMINESNDRLRLLHQQGDDSELKQQVAQEVARYREAYMQTIVDTRQLIDEARESYEILAKDLGVTQAIRKMNETAKPQLKLGPSREFLANVANFEKIERSVLTEKVELRKQGGVFWVDVTFNGKITKPMVFDTGASFSTLSSSLAAEIGLRPKPSDPTIKCQTADGSIVEAKQMTIGSMRVGKFTVKDVLCAVMPPGKGDVDPLLGQSFHRHFTYNFTPDSGRLTLSQVDEGDQGKSSSSQGRKKSTTKAKRGSRARSRSNPDLPVDETP
jgi:clan AA aspartic protease (TIGR02281 family)